MFYLAVRDELLHLLQGLIFFYLRIQHVILLLGPEELLLGSGSILSCSFLGVFARCSSQETNKSALIRPPVELLNLTFQQYFPQFFSNRCLVMSSVLIHTF